MKKLLFMFLIVGLYFSINYQQISFANSNYSYVLDQTNDEMFNNYIKVITGYKEEIRLLAKTVLQTKEQNDKNKINEYLKDINFLKTQISDTINDLDKDYKIKANEQKITDRLQSISIILVQYKFALTQLSYFLTSNNPDDNFNQLDLFFGFFNDSNQKLNCLINNCIAW